MASWRTPTLVVTTTLLACTIVGTTGDQPAPQPTTDGGTSIIRTAQDGLQLTAAMMCPYDMPECTATARDRYRNWLRDKYGSVAAGERVQYGHRLKRKIIRVATTIFHNHHPNRAFHPRRKWRHFRRADRCFGSPYVADRSGTLHWNRFCSHRFYNDPVWGTARKFVKGIELCKGEIALAIIGARGLSAVEGRTVVAGTGSLCAINQWERMPPARR